MGRELIKDHRITKNLKNRTFQDTTFDGLSVFAGKITNCEFTNVHFIHSKLGSNTKYSNCKFTNCQIEGKNSTLGSPTTYSNCTFENCTFKGGMIFMGAIFEDCLLSGTFSNCIFINEKRWFKRLSTFNNCDLTNVKFKNITFNSERTFNRCELPKSGIRRFRNDNDELLSFVNSHHDSELTDSISILFHSQIKKKQNPILFDESTLHTFLQPDEIKIFEQLTNGFEIKQI